MGHGVVAVVGRGLPLVVGASHLNGCIGTREG